VQTADGCGCALQLVCSSLSAAAGWCIFYNICPQEGAIGPASSHSSGQLQSVDPLSCTAARDVEDCIGISNSIGRAPIIPSHCAERAARLEACVQSKQALAEERTNRCQGPQPIK
jgi:hypothetical protein